MARGTERSILAIASTNDHFIDILDGYSFERISRIGDLIPEPHEIAWDPKRRVMYLTHTYRAGGYGEKQEKAHEVSVIDIETAEVRHVIDISPFRAPHDVAYDVDRDLIYVGVEAFDGQNGVVMIDAETYQIACNIPLEPKNSHWLAINWDSSKLYVSHKEHEEISVIDLNEQRLLTTIPCPGGAEEIDCAPSSPFAYVATPILNVTNNVSQGALNRNPPSPDEPGPRLLKIDTRTDEVVGSLEFDEMICAVHVTEDNQVLVSEMHFPDPSAKQDLNSPGVLHIVDGGNMNRLREVVLEELPFTSRSSPEGDLAAVTNLKSGTVNIVDPGSGQVVRTINHNVGKKFGGTHGLCWVKVGAN